jgi:hypothetical protein
MKRLTFAAAVAVAVAALVAQTAAAQDPEGVPLPGSPASAPVHVDSAAKSCSEQLAGDTGRAVVSQNFEPEFNVYDNRGADDFTLLRRCTIATVEVIGTYFDGIGGADSVDVKFYADGGGTPGALLEHRKNLGYSDPTGTGSFTIPLAVPVPLKAGTYWVSVRANIDFSTRGQWGWSTVGMAKGSHAKWKNPGDGFGTGCVTYGDLKTCVPVDEGPDFAFALLK